MHTYYFFHNSLMLNSKKKPQTSSTLQCKRSSIDFHGVFLPSCYHVWFLFQITFSSFHKMSIQIKQEKKWLHHLTLKINSFLSQELQGVSYVYRILCTMWTDPWLNLQCTVEMQNIHSKAVWWERNKIKKKTKDFQPIDFFLLQRPSSNNLQE